MLPEKDASEPIAFQVAADAVRDAVTKLPWGSAPGVSGWTFRAIKTVVMHRSKQDNDTVYEASIQSIVSFSNACYRGELCDRVMDLLTSSRSVLIPKPAEPGSVRPLGIGESWYRLIGRIAVAALGEGVGLELMPLQLAVGIPGGVEIAARLCQLFYDYSDSYDAGGMDMKNAFNKLRRGPIYDGLLRYCPSMCRFFRSAYGRRGILRNSQGEIVGESQTGVRQGDPLAFMFFCCGLHPYLIKLNATFKELCGEAFGLLWAYADDIHIGGPDEACVTFFNSEMPAEFADAGITFVPHKFKLTGRSVPAELPYATSKEGMYFLGAPIGNGTFVGAEVTAAAKVQAEDLGILPLIDPQSGILILKQCINRRPGYIARVVEQSKAEWGLGVFDFAVSKAIAKLIDATTDAEVDMIASLRVLPEVLGGLNIPAHRSVSTDVGLLASRATVRKFVESAAEELIPQMDALPQVNLDRWIDTQSRRRAGTADPSVDTSTKKLAALSFLGSAQKAVLQKLERDGRLQDKVWLEGNSFPNSARWMRWFGGHRRMFIWKSADYKAALRLRLLLPTFSNHNALAAPILCACKPSDDPLAIDLSLNRLHCLDCAKNRALHITRHNGVRDSLVHFLKRFCRDGGNVTPEVGVPGTGGRADIMARSNVGIISYVDAAVVNPAAPTYMAAPTTMFEHYKNIKRTKYAGLQEAHGRFVPFIVSATGQLDDEAMQFIGSFMGPQNSTLHFLRSTCYSEINVIVAQHNAAMQLISVRHASRAV